MTTDTQEHSGTQTIPLAQLKPHPANSNVMPDRLVEKLAAHIQRSGRYPPLIVRPLDSDTYQLLDGHHRHRALQQLGHTDAQCIVWQADDDEALLLLATLNRLQGQDDPRKRAALVAKLTKHGETKTLSRLLPERAGQIKKLLDLSHKPPAPRKPKPVSTMPVAVHFFLLPEQKKTLDHRLKSLGGTREEALMKLVEGSGV